ncbi:hypothetical protein AVT97_gp57 [Sulfolobales Virus YNP2]|uniref:hypothetical protein n=1 Tax=Sulfolobales Virus YNP2 TaxID=1732180 RepID=UPI000706653A|nr:hypothetical protein AVT97_gp57 [Sulfolobales Virus YNP2]ALG97220.1 hypothetical protein [Sulfolobales Virus YNP2]
MGREDLLLKIYEMKGEIVRTFNSLRKDLLGVKDVADLISMPAWAKSRIKDENGAVEIKEDGYGGRILVIKLEDPQTDRLDEKGEEDGIRCLLLATNLEAHCASPVTVEVQPNLQNSEQA